MNKIDIAIKHLSDGGLVIVVDDENRESEGDLVGVASLVTADSINFMTKFGRGLICAPISQSYAKKLNLNEMTKDNSDPFGTAFTISVDSTETSTGISAEDRAKTIRELANPQSTEDSFFRPGHMFPLIAKNGGIFERRGHTEASIELAKLTGNAEVAYICEILNVDGSMARYSDLELLSKEWDIPLITIDELSTYLLNKNVIEVKLPTSYGDFNLRLFEDYKRKEHLLIYKGEIHNQDKPVLIRIHSECITGDVFGSIRCDCGEQLKRSMELINKEGMGAVLYMRQEGRGIGLKNKLLAYKLQENGKDTYDANVELGFLPDERNYRFSAEILKALGIKTIKLLTNNPEKVSAMKNQGIEVAEQILLQTKPLKENSHYLKTKKQKFNHKLYI